MSSLTTKLAAGAAIAAAAAGGATFANAAQSASPSPTPASQSGGPGGGAPGAHTVGGRTEQPLTGDVAAKVRAAALAKVSGTVERVETNVDGSAPYEAHITRSDGTPVEVQVSKDYRVVAVNAMGQHP